ncbi:unnamed protein product [Lota lota]
MGERVSIPLDGEEPASIHAVSCEVLEETLGGCCGFVVIVTLHLTPQQLWMDCEGHLLGRILANPVMLTLWQCVSFNNH